MELDPIDTGILQLLQKILRQHEAIREEVGFHAPIADLVDDCHDFRVKKRLSTCDSDGVRVSLLLKYVQFMPDLVQTFMRLQLVGAITSVARKVAH